MTTSVAGIVPEWTLGDRLRKARELTGLDRAAFALELGVSRNTVSAYELNERAKPRVVVLRSWALRCGVSQQWLETGRNEQGGPSGGGESLLAAGVPGPSIYFHGNAFSHVSIGRSVGAVAA